MPVRLYGLVVAAAAFCLTFANVSSALAQSAQTDTKCRGVIMEHNVMVAMRDGVRLSTDIFRPEKPGKFPVVLTRNPYANSPGLGAETEACRWAQNGYVFIHQDVRSRYDSEGGRFYPYKFEANDSFDAQEWAGAQQWSNGKVGTAGVSYLAAVQWFSAPYRSSSLVAIAPGLSPLNYYKDAAYMGGAFRLAGRTSWATFMGGRKNQTAQIDWREALKHLPLKTLDTSIGFDLPHLRDWIANPQYGEYWQHYDAEAQIQEIDVPAYNIAGWYDAFLRGNLLGHQKLTANAHSETARANQKLIIGPWVHSAELTSKVGALDFGEGAAQSLFDLNKRWFDFWLKNKKNGIMSEPPVRLFVMGENKWRDENEWPLARTQYTNYYFRSLGSANSLSGNGQLTPNAPEIDEPADTFTYDPKNPVPTIGGNIPGVVAPGPFDQTKVEQRQDVLVFTSAPLLSNIEVTGPITVTLYAASSAPDTDFTAKLVDVHPDGKAYNLADGIIRARYRLSDTKPELINPGKIYEYTIDLWATSNLFKQGHRIRVDISSSNFPRFDRNPNTGDAFGQNAKLKKAHQTVYHTPAYPSHITLPVIPR